VPIGLDEGLKHDSWVLCDTLASLRKSELIQFIGSLPTAKMPELDRALSVALDLQ
jgi:mRNA interferase MazF